MPVVYVNLEPLSLPAPPAPMAMPAMEPRRVMLLVCVNPALLPQPYLLLPVSILRVGMDAILQRGEPELLPSTPLAPETEISAMVWISAIPKVNVKTFPLLLPLSVTAISVRGMAVAQTRFSTPPCPTTPPVMTGVEDIWEAVSVRSVFIMLPRHHRHRFSSIKRIHRLRRRQIRSDVRRDRAAFLPVVLSAMKGRVARINVAPR